MECGARLKLVQEWTGIVATLPVIIDVKIPRWIGTTNSSVLELRGFADASGKAFAAVVYAKTLQCITLLAAKLKVNPIKNKKTLQKLELCAAYLLSKLMNSLIEIINRKFKLYVWSELAITLAWINKEEKLKDKFIRRNKAEYSLSNLETCNVKGQSGRCGIQRVKTFFVVESVWVAK